MNSPVPDFSSRLGAVVTHDHAFVWASAGTGKTHTLTLRAMTLLFRLGGSGLVAADRNTRIQAARASAKSLIMTTFTRKAAAEMQTRLFRYLDRIARAASILDLQKDMDPLFLAVINHLISEMAPGRRDKGTASFERFQTGASALTEVAANFQIQTLHSLAVGILSRHPVEAGLPSGCRLAREDEDDLLDFEERILQRWWQVQASEDTAIQDDLEVVTARVPFTDIQGWLTELNRYPWICDLLPGRSAAQQTEVQEAIEALQSLASALRGMRGLKQSAQGRRLDSLLNSPGEIGWTEICQFLIDNEKYLFVERQSSLSELLAREPVGIQTTLAGFGRLYQRAQDAALGQVCNAAAWGAWHRIASRFVNWVRDAGVRELGLLGFDEIILSTLRLLAGHPAVRAFEQSRIRAILVDEFQDTDPVQLNLLRLLLEVPSESDEGAVGFFVGDPKQSIYRFRGADVSSVEAFRVGFQKTTAGRRPIQDFHLQTSFRSSSPILEFVNQWFSDSLRLGSESERLLPSREETARRPRLIQIVPAGTPIQKPARKRLRLCAAEAVAQAIRDYLDTAPVGSLRSYRDILVLTRTNSELDQLLPVLHRAGIPVIATGARTFYRQHEVLDILNLLISLHHPGDSLAVAAVLRSPLLLLADPEIDRLLVEAGSGPLFHGSIPLPDWLPAYARQRIVALRELAASRTKEYLPDWLAHVLEFVPRFAYLDPTDCEGRAQARIERIARAFCEDSLRGEVAPLVWLVRQRNRATRADQHNADLGEDVALADETVDAVRAMTIHKAKGLEGEFVILLDWNDLLTRCLEPKAEKGWVFGRAGSANPSLKGFRLPWGPLTIQSPDYTEAALREKQENAAEAVRIAYVAATRARSALLLLDPGKARSKNNEAIRVFKNACAVPPSIEIVETEISQPVIRYPDTKPIQVDANAYRSLWRERLPSGELRPVLQRPTGEDDWPPEEAPHGPGRIREKAQDIGVLVHRYLENWITETGFEENLLATAAGWTSISNDDVLQSARTILRNFFAGATRDSLGRPLVERVRNSKIVAREFPFFLEIDTVPWNGVLDLVIEEDGILKGVDFKTGPPGRRLSLSQKKQQEIYSEALRRIRPGRECYFEFWWLGENPLQREAGAAPVKPLKGPQIRLPFND